MPTLQEYEKMDYERAQAEAIWVSLEELAWPIEDDDKEDE